MTVTKTMIFNMALHELGVSAPISDANSSIDNRAVIIQDYYNTAKEEVLKAFDWNFAEKYRALSLSNDTSLDPRFEYVYDYPNDCLSARTLYCKEAGINKKKFKVSANERGDRVILTNISPAILRYTRRVDNESFFSPEFSNALASYLAGLAGQAITGSADLANIAMKRYWDKIRMAQISNTAEGQEVDSNDRTYLDVR